MLPRRCAGGTGHRLLWTPEGFAADSNRGDFKEGFTGKPATCSGSPTKCYQVDNSSWFGLTFRNNMNGARLAISDNGLANNGVGSHLLTKYNQICG